MALSTEFDCLNFVEACDLPETLKAWLLTILLDRLPDPVIEIDPIAYARKIPKKVGHGDDGLYIEVWESSVNEVIVTENVSDDGAKRWKIEIHTDNWEPMREDRE